MLLDLLLDGVSIGELRCRWHMQSWSFIFMQHCSSDAQDFTYQLQLDVVKLQARVCLEGQLASYHPRFRHPDRTMVLNFDLSFSIIVYTGVPPPLTA